MKTVKNKPLEKIVRRRTHSVNVGDVLVGGDAIISVQSMTNTLTPDIVATLNQIETIKNAGADIVRVTCPDFESTKALKTNSKKSIKVFFFSTFSIIFSSKINKLESNNSFLN